METQDRGGSFNGFRAKWQLKSFYKNEREMTRKDIRSEKSTPLR